MANKEHPLYFTWKNMRNRCNNPNVDMYPRYGGRGIKYCPAWDSFAQFVEDIGPKPGPAYSIDRIDNDGDYTPENCRWATNKEQSNPLRKGLQSNNTSGVKGVSFNNRKRVWVAYANIDGYKVMLYRGSSFEMACKARWTWEQQPTEKG